MSLLPCPFCGMGARLLGGPDAQESYSIWCTNGHHMNGGMDSKKLIKKWNTRHYPKEVQRVLDAVRAIEGFEDMVGSWGCYASSYFQEKWDFDGDLEKCKAVDDAIRALEEKG